jgi:hypothetical protein
LSVFSLLFNVCDLGQGNFSLGAEGKRGKLCRSQQYSITVNTQSFHLRAEDAELRMELRLPALQQKVFITKNKQINKMHLTLSYSSDIQ